MEELRLGELNDYFFILNLTLSETRNTFVKRTAILSAVNCCESFISFLGKRFRSFQEFGFRILTMATP